MQFRTDLAIESSEALDSLPEGVKSEEKLLGDIKITRIFIETTEGERALGRPMGKYITVEVPSLLDNTASERSVAAVLGELEKLLPKTGSALVVGLGNKTITPDALGPTVCERILATRHIKDELKNAVGTKTVRSVSSVAPGVLGQTGIESLDIIKGIVKAVKPEVVITVDALASRRLNRLGKTVQMSNTGIEPGAGVGNARKELSRNTLGVPVIAIGVPTVVDAGTLAYEITGEAKNSTADDMIVTPREIDLIIDRAATLIADAINFSLQQEIEPAIIKQIMG